MALEAQAVGKFVTWSADVAVKEGSCWAMHVNMAAWEDGTRHVLWSHMAPLSSPNGWSIEAHGLWNGSTYRKSFSFRVKDDQYGYIDESLVANTWYRVFWMYDGAGSGNSGRLRCWVDGVEKTLAYSGTIPTTYGADIGQTHFIGKHTGATPRKIENGRVAECACWNTVPANFATMAAEWGAGKHAMSFKPKPTFYAPLFPDEAPFDYSGREASSASDMLAYAHPAKVFRA